MKAEIKCSGKAEKETLNLEDKEGRKGQFWGQSEGRELGMLQGRIV